MGLGQPVKVMLKRVYDADEDGKVDTAEGIQSVTDLPANPTKGDVAEKSGKMYVAIEV